MRATGIYSINPTKKFAGFLLAILFLTIPLTLAIHSHHTDEDHAKPTTEQSISGIAEKCLICDYTAEIKGKQLLLAYPPTISIPNQTCITLNTFVYTRIYKFTIQNFSNKGPPSLLS